MSGNPRRQIPVAVVGVGALLPGSTDAGEFWRTVVAGRDMITDIPPSHWLVDDYYDPDPAAPDKTYARRGAFLPEVGFDPVAYGIPPKTLPATDTAQLLALMVADQVLTDAGGLAGLDRDRVGVVLGAAAMQLLSHMNARIQRPVWLKALRDNGLPEDEAQAVCDSITDAYTPWQESTFPGLLGNVVAGRIANRFDLHGTNHTTDAACASSFAALSTAVAELSLGRSDLVISGGVDTTNDIGMFMCFSKTPALSPSGDCRPLSDAADGTMLGEGIAMYALKRLSDAERDGDRIYAVIRGIGTSSDGRSSAIYAPLPEGQARALRRTYEEAGYGPETVELVEAHGTGTKAGDAAEFAALRTVFGESGRTDRQWCAIGSVKSQIGHTKCAAGAVGLLKAVMALHHKVLPPTVKVDRPNPTLEITDSAFYVNTRARPWVRSPDHPRRASVSSFGFGGSNFHVSLEEYASSGAGGAPGRRPGEGRAAWRTRSAPTELVLFSAPSAASLLERRIDGDRALADLARESQSAFSPTDAVRLAIVATGTEDLRDTFDRAAALIRQRPDTAFSAPGGIHYGTGAATLGRVGFLFPGQGSQYVGMGAGLAMLSPTAQAVWDRLGGTRFDGRPLHRAVFPPPAFTDEERTARQKALTATEWAQPALAVHSLALLAVVRELGLRPDCVAGHSFGELVALHAAGALDAESLVGLARRRGELMRDAAVTPGAMLAVGASRARVAAVITESGLTDVWPANHNAPGQVVVSGATGTVDALEQKLTAEGIATRRLHASTAFHSPLVAPAGEPLLAYLRGITVSQPRLDVYGNADAAPYPSSPDEIRHRVASHLASPVLFDEEIEAMYAAGVRTFVEVGAGATLTGLVGQILGDREHLAVALDRQGDHGADSLHTALARLAVRGAELTYDGLWAPYAPPPAAAKEKKPRMTVKISGANYGQPYPPAGGSAALPPPNPPRQDATPAPEPVAKAGPAPVPMASTAAFAPPAHEPAPAPAAAAAPAPVPFGEVPPTAPPASPVDPHWFSVVESVQRQAAEAHAACHRMLVESHMAFLKMTETTFAAMLGARGIDVADGTAAVATTPMPAMPAMTPMPAPSGLPPVPTSMPAPGLAAEVSVPVTPPTVPAAPPAWLPAQSPAPVPPPPGAFAPAASVVAPAEPAHDLEGLLLSVVAEHTGYPASMLTSDMELESDLGIDSIKRVEILSALRQHVGDVPAEDIARLGKLRTLREIGEALQGRSTTDVMTDSPAPAPAVSPSAAPAATAFTPPHDLEGLLLSVVAEHTGYPASMLTSDMELESDLGIDSIKRVEILSALRQHVGDVPAEDIARLGKLRTLREIGEALTPDSHPEDRATAGPEIAAARAEPEQRTALRRLALRTVDAPAPGLAMAGLGDGSLSVTEDGSGIAELVVAKLTGHGFRATVVREVPDDAHGVVHLGGLAGTCSPGRAAEARRDVFRAARAVASHRAAHGGVLVTVQDTGGDFGLDARLPERAWLGGIASLARTLAKEWPAASVKAIDCERGGRDAGAVADAIVGELLSGGPTEQVGLRADGTRVTLHAVPVPLEPGRAARVGPDSVVVATGGARGVTAAALLDLARTHRPRIVLLGRTELADEPPGFAAAGDEAALTRLLAECHGDGATPAGIAARARAVLAAREVRATLTELEKAGSPVRYVAVDVRDGAAVAAALREVREVWGPVTAIVHGAGVLADKLIAEKTDEQFEQVVSTKVDGLAALLAATRGDPLDVICLFSSVAAVFGNAGQSDYAMANGVLDHVASAEQAARPGCLVRSIAWGPWQGGMVTPALAEHFGRSGVALIPLGQGASAFTAELSSPGGDARVVVAAGDGPGPLAPDGRPRPAQVRLREATHPYLADHEIAGVPVLPVAMALEWFAGAASAWRPGAERVVLRDLRVFNKIVLPRLGQEGHLLTVHGRAATTGAPSGLEAELRTEDDTPRFRALLDFETGTAGSVPWDSPDGLTPPARADVYDGRALFHGPRFHGIRAVHGVGGRGAEATVAGVAGLGWAGDHGQLDPAAVDGALQVALVWAEHVLDDATLPMAVAECRIHRRGPVEDTARCVVRARKVHDTGARCDVALIDADGSPRVELIGVELVRRPRPSDRVE